MQVIFVKTSFQYQIGVLVGFYSKETVALIRGAKYVTERPRIGHILCNERDLVNRMMVEAILRIKINFKYLLNV